MPGARGSTGTLVGLVVAFVALAAATAHAQPASVRVRAGAAGVEIVDTSTGKLVSAIPQRDGVRDLLVRGTVLYVASGTTGVVVVDLRDVSVPRGVRIIAEGHAVRRIEERWGQLLLYPVGEGRVLVYDAADPLRPTLDAAATAAGEPAPPSSGPASQSASQPAAPRGTVDVTRRTIALPDRSAGRRDAAASASPAPSLALREGGRGSGLTRVYLGTTPAWNFGCHILTGGTITVGVEHATNSGFLIGAELEPDLSVCMLGIYIRARAGYGGENAAVALTVSSGFPWLFTYPQVGPYFRLGSYAGLYAELSLVWNPMVLGPIPWGGTFKLSAPTAPDWRFLLVLGGDYYPMLGPYFLLGGQRTLSGSGHHGTGIFTFGIGMLFSLITMGIPGPILHFGYEYRF